MALLWEFEMKKALGFKFLALLKPKEPELINNHHETAQESEGHFRRKDEGH